MRPKHWPKRTIEEKRELSLKSYKCELCEEKGLYRVGNRNYCKFHKEDAWKDRARFSNWITNRVAQTALAKIEDKKEKRRRKDQLRGLHNGRKVIM